MIVDPDPSPVRTSVLILALVAAATIASGAMLIDQATIVLR